MDQARYSSVAVTLHWVIAILILGQIAGGLYMHNLPNSAPEKFDFYQLHKSFGLSILSLTIVRLGWRLMHKPPALPAAAPGWQKIIARITHWIFYALLFLTPLAGWAMVSVSPLNLPTYWFGLFEIPHLPFFDGVEDRGALEDTFKERHAFLAFSILALLALHVGAALKHGFLNKDGVLRSMAPKVGAYIGIAAIFVVLGIGAVFYSIVGSAEKNSDVSPVVEALNSGEPFELTRDEKGSWTIEPMLEQEVAPTSDEKTDDAVLQTPTIEEASPVGARATSWIVDEGASALKFIGEEGGASFEGTFSDFSADIIFSPDALSESSIMVEVRTASAASGNEFRDGTMVDSEWFDVKDHPTATFKSSVIRNVGAGAYEADGALTIKDLSKDITLAFTLDIDGDNANAAGGVDVIRTDYGLGMNSSWLEKENVALGVRIEFEIAAKR